MSNSLVDATTPFLKNPFAQALAGSADSDAQPVTANPVIAAATPAALSSLALALIVVLLDTLPIVCMFCDLLFCSFSQRGQVRGQDVAPLDAFKVYVSQLDLTRNMFDLVLFALLRTLLWFASIHHFGITVLHNSRLPSLRLGNTFADMPRSLTTAAFPIAFSFPFPLLFTQFGERLKLPTLMVKDRETGRQQPVEWLRGPDWLELLLFGYSIAITFLWMVAAVYFMYTIIQRTRALYEAERVTTKVHHSHQAVQRARGWGIAIWKGTEQQPNVELHGASESTWFLLMSVAADDVVFGHYRASEHVDHDEQFVPINFARAGVNAHGIRSVMFLAISHMLILV